MVSLSTAVASGLTSSQVTGNGSTSVTITAPLAAINATLANANGLTYTPNSGYSGSDSLTLSGNDQIGNTDTLRSRSRWRSLSRLRRPTSTQSVKINSSLVVSNVAIADPTLPTTSNVTLTLNRHERRSQPVHPPWPAG